MTRTKTTASHTTSTVLRRSRNLALALTASAALALTACAPPGPAGNGPGTTSPGEISTTLTTDDITIEVMTNTEAADALTQLTDAFTAQHPNVTFDIVADANANLAANMSRILTREDPPSLIFTPSVGQLAEDALLADLDPYAEAFGWDSWSQELLDINRVSADGQRGSGPLYAVGIGYNITYRSSGSRLTCWICGLPGTRTWSTSPITMHNSQATWQFFCGIC